MIKKVSSIVSSKPVILPSVVINDIGTIKYIGQSGTSGYASAAKGYLADYVLRNTTVSWMPLLFDNSNNDKNYYVLNRDYEYIGLNTKKKEKFIYLMVTVNLIYLMKDLKYFTEMCNEYKN